MLLKLEAPNSTKTAKGKVDGLESNVVKQGQYTKARQGAPCRLRLKMGDVLPQTLQTLVENPYNMFWSHHGPFLPIHLESVICVL